MTNYAYARAAARLFAEEPPAGANRPSSGDVRSATIAIMEGEIRKLGAPRPVRSPRIWLAAAAGLTLVAGLGVGWRIARPPVPRTADARISVRVEGQHYSLFRGARVGEVVEASEMLPGDHVQTGTGDGATLVLSTGTRVAIAGQSDVQLRDWGREDQRFWLQSGAVTATVAKLGPQERFLVQTPDSEIEAHGTVFSVKVDGGRTRVCLEEGVVVWRQAGRETKMVASNGHPVGCEEATVSAGPAPPVDSPTVEKPKVRPAEARLRTREAPAGVPQTSPRSSLAQQNDLFTAAMAAEREGNLALALSRLESLLARFPEGSLAESAKAEVVRLHHSRIPSATDF